MPPATMSPKNGFLGPAGTFTESAFRSFFPGEQGRAIPHAPAAWSLLNSGEVQSVVMEAGWALEGTPCVQFEEIAAAGPFYITGEVLVPASLALLTAPGTNFSDVSEVASHANLFAACRAWLREHLPHAVYVPVGDSTEAAASLLDAEDAKTRNRAALCAPAAAQRFTLDIAMAGISNDTSSYSRYIKVGKAGHMPGPTGSDKTSIIVYQGGNETGSLARVTSVFTGRKIGIARMQTRITDDIPRGYAFTIDLEEHISNDALGDALKELYQWGKQVDFLGSYPAHRSAFGDTSKALNPRSAYDADTWLQELRTGEHPRA